MAIWEKLLGTGIKETVEAVGSVVDSAFTNDEERLKAKAEITQIVTDYTKSIAQSASEVLKVELSGNWLQRSWRPILMLAFGFIVIYEYFIAPVTGLKAIDLPIQFWSLLEIGIGGYVIGRSVEKVTEKVAENLDKIPRRKDK
jgi:hypothetical protein